MTEKELLEEVRKLAALHGWLFYHTHDSHRSEPGFPDVVLANANHRIIFLELKREGKGLSDERKVTKTGRVLPSQVDWAFTLMHADGVEYGGPFWPSDLEWLAGRMQ